MIFENKPNNRQNLAINNFWNFLLYCGLITILGLESLEEICCATVSNQEKHVKALQVGILPTFFHEALKHAFAEKNI